MPETMEKRIPKFEDWVRVRKDGRDLYYPLRFDRKDVGYPLPGIEVEASRDEMYEIARRVWEAPSLNELGKAVLVFKKGNRQ